jgi:hypothetical protein
MVPPLRMASARALARRDHVADAVPGEARAQLGELVGGIAAAEQIEHASKALRGEPPKGAALRTSSKSSSTLTSGLGFRSIRPGRFGETQISQRAEYERIQ